MGVDIELYRLRIGVFVQPNTCRKVLRSIYVPGRCILTIMRIYILFAVLVVNLSGDVELNPGPPKPSEKSSEPRARTRQQTLSFAGAADRRTSSGMPFEAGRLSRSPVGGSQSELFSFLTHMKNDLSTQMTTQNHDVMREVGTINRKIDGLTKKVNDLQSENETLKRENSKMQKQLNSVISKLDYIEGQSRRNNVRITGLHGRIDEEWATTEQKVRSFITNELDMQELDQVDIDRAHRIKSSDQNKCTVIVKFNRFKDREAVLKKASEILDNDSPYTVRQDLTQRVKKHRRELGKEMIAAKARGQQARIKFDKLEVDGDLYRYDDTLEEIVLIPRTRGRSQVRARAGSGDALRHTQENGGLVDRIGGDSAGIQSEAEGVVMGGAMGGPDDVFS